MALLVDPDLFRSASHRNMIDHVSGPLRSGAVDSALTINANGRVVRQLEAYEPLVVAAPSASLEDSGLILEVTVDPDNAASPKFTIEFASFSETGGFLPVYLPKISPQTRTTAGFTLALALRRVNPDGTTQAVSVAKIRDQIELRLIQGILGRLIYVLGAEKQRIRRQAREIVAQRLLKYAHRDALDRNGADLGVARFTDVLRFDQAANQIFAELRRQQGQPDAAPEPEPDREYRRRLAIYRPFLLSSARRVLERLNGPGEGGNNQGLLGEMGFQPRFTLNERDNEFAVAIQLVASGDDNFRLNFLKSLRLTTLVWPENTNAANDAHQKRFLPSRQKTRIESLRAGLRDTFTFPANAALAPMLALVLHRVGQCRRALGDNSKWNIQRAQDDNGGSRFELGLGAGLQAPAANVLDTMIARLQDVNRVPANDPEIEAILKSLKPQPAARDPEARWLLESCGLRTVHRTTGNSVYLSHLPVYGMLIEKVAGLPPSQVKLLAKYHAPGDPGQNAVLLEGLARAAQEWQAGGGAPWNSILDANAPAEWGKAVAIPQPASDVIAATGLRAIRTGEAQAAAKLQDLVAQLKRLPVELIETIRLPAALANDIRLNQNNPVSQLRALLRIFEKNNITSVLPLLLNNNDILFIVSVTPLPLSGILLSDQRSTGFRWYTVPIADTPRGEVTPTGSRVVYKPKGNGLEAVVVLGYARRGLTDPYEVRFELPDDARLSLAQYEFLMNFLQHLCPAGVEINTYNLRQRHVDLDGDGNAEPLPPKLARTFRQFRRRRQQGEVGVMIEASQQ